MYDTNAFSCCQQKSEAKKRLIKVSLILFFTNVSLFIVSHQKSESKERLVKFSLKILVRLFVFCQEISAVQSLTVTLALFTMCKKLTRSHLRFFFLPGTAAKCQSGRIALLTWHGKSVKQHWPLNKLQKVHEVTQALFTWKGGTLGLAQEVSEVTLAFSAWLSYYLVLGLIGPISFVTFVTLEFQTLISSVSVLYSFVCLVNWVVRYFAQVS